MTELSKGDGMLLRKLPHINSSKTKFESLQILRGVSALAVLLFHSRLLAITKLGARDSFWNYFKFGHGGVDVFFVLSGFIMYYIHEKDFGNPERLKSFLLKRGIRIYPVYWIITLAVLPAFFLAPEEIKAYKSSFWFIIQCLTLFPVNGLPIIPPAWSLSHEVKFYCLFALAILLPNRFAFWIIGLIAMFSLGACLVQLFPETHSLAGTLSQKHLLFFLINPYNLEFAAGSLCAYVLNGYSIKKNGVILGAGIFLFLVVAIFDNMGQLAVNWLIPCYGISSAVLVFGAAACNFQSSSPVFRSFVFLGDVSYSLYLIHYPLCTLVCILMLKLGIVKFGGIYMATLLMVFFVLLSSCLFHRLVERPILSAAHRYLLKHGEI
jgi:exopolysaccharide production protein ExoZ